MLNKILGFEKTFTVTKAAFIVGFFALLAKMFAFIREPLLTSTFGGEKIYVLDVYYAAFRIPDFLMTLFILGTLSVALIPLFVEILIKDENRAQKFANTIATLALTFMGGLFLLLYIFAEPITQLLVPGFSEELLKLTVGLTRLIILSQLIFTLSNICTNLLYSYKRFIMAGIAPTLYNVGIIFGILFLYPRVGIMGLGYGVLLGAAAHLLVQIPELARSSFRLRPTLKLKDPAIKKFFQLYLPRILAVDLSLFSLLISTFIASKLASGSIGLFTIAMNLLSLPVSIIALSLATAVFPALSEAYAQGQEQKFLRMLKKTLIQVFYFMVPLALLMLIFRAQGVRLIYGHGNFTWENTILTFNILGVLVFALVSQSLTPILARAFYSRQNTIIPVVVNLCALAVNAGLAFWLKDTYGIIGVAAAFSVASILNAIILFIVLRIRLYKSSVTALELKEFDDGLVTTCLKIVLASILMAVAAYAGLYLIEPALSTQTVIGLLIQLSGATLIGLVVFLASSSLLKLKESRIILDACKKVLSFIPIVKNF